VTTTRYTVTVDGLPDQLGAEGRMVFDWTADSTTSTDDIEGQARMMAVDALRRLPNDLQVDSFDADQLTVTVTPTT
jgi:hypothetical protein